MKAEQIRIWQDLQTRLILYVINGIDKFKKLKSKAMACSYLQDSFL